MRPAGRAGERPRPSRRSGVRSDWRTILAIYTLAVVVEGIGVSQVFAFVPAYLASMGVPDPDRTRFVGLFGSLLFLLGAPLVPLWGVWAEKHSRKVVIVRSSLVLAVVLVGAGLSREPWQLAASILLFGLQLGNTGVMLAAIREVVPPDRLGRAIGVFGAGGPIGFALGPLLGGALVDGAGIGIGGVYLVSSAFALGIALLLVVGSDEVRPTVVPSGSTLRLAYGALRSVLADRVVLGVFAVYAVVFLANQMTRPYVPLLVERVVPAGGGLASSIGFVTGLAALGGALVSPLGGALGDRVGFRPVLVGALVGGGVALLAMPALGTIAGLAAGALTLAAMFGVASAMVFGLLATETPPERRSATLNLVYLPLYAAGIVGPTTGALAVGAFGLPGPFLLGCGVFATGALVVARRRSRA